MGAQKLFIFPEQSRNSTFAASCDEMKIFALDSDLREIFLLGQQHNPLHSLETETLWTTNNKKRHSCSFFPTQGIKQDCDCSYALKNKLLTSPKINIFQLHCLTS